LMPDVHGTRRCYRQGCRRVECRAANAAYQRHRRQTLAKGLPLLGAIVKATEAKRRINQLKAEHVPVAKWLGLKGGSVRLHPDGVTIRKLLKIRALWRKYVAEPDEQNP
jgi:hypothetical protein